METFNFYFIQFPFYLLQARSGCQKSRGQELVKDSHLRLFVSFCSCLIAVENAEYSIEWYLISLAVTDPKELLTVVNF